MVYESLFLIIYVTKQMANDTDSADRPAPTSSEASISPAMIRAGEIRLSELEGLPAAYVASEVFAAMTAAARQPPGTPRSRSTDAPV